MPDKSLTVSILRNMDQVAALRDEWEELFEAVSASPCVSYEWFASLASYMQPTNDLRVCVIRDSKGTVGIIPLRFRKRFAFGVLPMSTVAIVGGGWANECPVLLAERAHGMPVVQAALEKLRRTSKKWTYCDMIRVPRTSAVVSNCNRNATDMPHIKCEYQTAPGNVVLELPGSMDEYRKTLSSNFRQLVSRRVRGLSRKGEVKLVRLGLDTVQSEERISRLIEDSIAVSQKSWQGESESGRAISGPDVQGFFANVAVALSRRGMTDLSVLYLDSKPISFIWGVTRGGKSSVLKLGFDSDFQQFSAGVVHFARLVEDSIERGMTEIDFGSEFREYKKKWSKRERDLCHVWYYPPGLRSSLIRWWRRHRERRAGPEDQ